MSPGPISYFLMLHAEKPIIYYWKVGEPGAYKAKINIH
jgi:hypothetical protein